MRMAIAPGTGTAPHGAMKKKKIPLTAKRSKKKKSGGKVAGRSDLWYRNTKDFNFAGGVSTSMAQSLQRSTTEGN